MKHARSDYDTRIQDSAGLIPDDEPVLLIRGQDEAALYVIGAWLGFYSGDPRIDPALITSIKLHEHRIRDWQLTHGHKVADAPPEALK